MPRSLRHFVAVLLCGAAARAGIVAGSQAPLPAAGFELGLAAWTQAASDASTPFVLVAAPDGVGQAAYCDLPGGVAASLSLALPLAEVAGALPGTKLEARGRVWLSAAAGPGQLRLELQSYDGVAWTTLGLSAIVSGSAAPRGRWLRLSTLASPSNDARVPAGSQGLRFVFHGSVPGGVFFDELEVGRFEYAEYALADGDFEGPGPHAWQAAGALDVHDGGAQPDGYYGRQHLTLDSWSATRVWQSLECGGVTQQAAPDAGRELEVGAWLRLDPTMMLTLASDPDVYVELALYGVAAGGGESLLARSRWHPTLPERGAWRYLQSEPLGPVEALHTQLRLELSASLPGAVDVDFVQLGELHAVDGNPRRRVGANYVGRYRSPLFPGAGASATSAQERWRNWRWVSPNACDNSFTGFAHDPDCSTSAACLRKNGRRDLAVTTFDGEDQLPLVGAYDSRDPDVLRYHVDLATAAGIDHFVYDWLGHELALQSVLQGGEPLNEQAFEALLDVADEPGRDFKVAVMYEPKVHYFGWIGGQPSEAQKLAGIVDDLVWLVEHQRTRRCALRRDGRLVVFVFRDTVCTPDGSQCLDAAEWSAIALGVSAATGEQLFLIGDLVPAAGSPMSGVARWRLVDRSLLEFRTYQDVENGTPTWPEPQLAALEQHARGVHALGSDWAAQDDAERVQVPVVWPAFDDSGVGGWGDSNLVGEDGGALCVRVAHGFRGAFYPTVIASALDTGADWIQLATWNDWNEDTRLEPAWLANFGDGHQGAPVLPSKVRRHVFGRLLETQAWISQFKGRPLEPRLLARVALDYLRRAADSPAVTRYD